MTIDGRLARLDALIAQGKARAACYRGEHRASRHRAQAPIDTVANQERLRLQKDHPQPPPHPAPPAPPPTPSFPRLDPVAVAAFVTASARRARGDDEPSPPDPGEDGDRRKPEKEPPEPGSLILDAVRRRQEGR